MKYTTHNFVGGEKLYATQLNEMDNEIKHTSDIIDNFDINQDVQFSTYRSANDYWRSKKISQR